MRWLLYRLYPFQKMTFFEWYPPWHIILTSFLTYHLEVYSGDIFWHSIWHSFWHLFCGIYADIRSGILSGIYPDILSEEEEKKEEKKEKEATPIKSRDPHLVGGDKKLTVMLVVSLKDELPVRSKAEQIRAKPRSTPFQSIHPSDPVPSRRTVMDSKCQLRWFLIMNSFLKVFLMFLVKRKPFLGFSRKDSAMAPTIQGAGVPTRPKARTLHQALTFGPKLVLLPVSHTIIPAEE